MANSRGIHWPSYSTCREGPASLRWNLANPTKPLQVGHRIKKAGPGGAMAAMGILEDV